MAETFRWARIPESLQRAGTRLCGAAWILFVVSMFLLVTKSDAFDFPLYGWQCAVFTCAWPYFYYRGLVNDPTALRCVYLSCFDASNVIALTAPIGVRIAKRSLAKGRCLFVLLLFAFTVALSLLLPCNGSWTDLQIGYYVWMASFGLMAAGSLLLAEAQRVKSAPVPATVAPLPRTLEDKAAERELHDFLRSA